VGTGLLPVTSGFGLDGEPDQDFLKPISTGGTDGLNIPVSLMKKMQADLSMILAAFTDLGGSCLFTNTSNIASVSSSANILLNSSRPHWLALCHCYQPQKSDLGYFGNNVTTKV
jgi:hypothetical protein